MSILDCPLPDGWKRAPVSEHYRITKKPRELAPDPEVLMPFVPMDRVPAGGQMDCGHELRKPAAIASGIYFEVGDVLLSKITPSFENGKQGLVRSLPYQFGYGSTELIPLQAFTEDVVNPYLFYLLLHHEIRNVLASKMEGSTGRKRVPEGAVRQLAIPVPPRPEQEKIAAILCKLQRAIATQDKLLKATADLKQSAMQRLFTHGLCGEPLKDTEIGPMPSSWQTVSLGQVANVRAGHPFPHRCQGRTTGELPFYKVSDMNSEGNERELDMAANWIGSDTLKELKAKTLSVGTTVFPKVGGALLTNKKRLLSRESLVDNNIMGVWPKDPSNLRHDYLFAWFESIDLAAMANPGPLPSLNAGRLNEEKLPVPSVDEQRDIAATLATIDRKLAHHRRKRAALDALFQTTLHELMTGQLRVADLDIDTSEVATPAEAQGEAA